MKKWIYEPNIDQLVAEISSPEIHNLPLLEECFL